LKGQDVFGRSVELGDLRMHAGFLEKASLFGEKKMRDTTGRQMTDAHRSVGRLGFGLISRSQ
jgi:hypothetical protein